METIREFRDIMEEVMNDLRFLKGLDGEKVCKFRNLLTKIIEEWKDEEYVPKFLCNLFIDFYPCAEASACMYEESVRNEIMYFADEMADLMRMCVDSTLD